jgi:hypothetical protein
MDHRVEPGGDERVGWVERSETHHLQPQRCTMGFAALYPSYSRDQSFDSSRGTFVAAFQSVVAIQRFAAWSDARISFRGSPAAPQNQRGGAQKRRIFRRLRKCPRAISFVLDSFDDSSERANQPAHRRAHRGCDLKMRGGLRCLRAVSQTVPGRLRASCPPALRPVRGVLPLDWDRKGGRKTRPTKSQETWPEAAKPRRKTLGQSRGGAPRGVRARSGWFAQASHPWRAPHPLVRLARQWRLPALRLPSLLGGKHIRGVRADNSGAKCIARTRARIFPPPR